MDDELQRETRNLQGSWMRHEREMLRDYLVQDVEDPRINVSSILVRHWLTDALFPGRYEALMDPELQFAIVMNWLLPQAKAARPRWAEETLNALLAGEDAAGPAIPPHIFRLFESLPGECSQAVIGDYLTDALISIQGDAELFSPIPERVLDTFARTWRALLTQEPLTTRRLSVMEQACGSANDYRFLDSYGLSAWLDYAGQDLCEKNILNAREMFPRARFEVGNAMEIHAPDKSFDLCFTQDLLEHLSPAAMERAVAELCRITRRHLLVGFFNMHDRPEHRVVPVDEYHWNDLSATRTQAAFEKHGGKVQALEIDSFLASRYGCTETHNKGAWTFVVSFA